MSGQLITNATLFPAKDENVVHDAAVWVEGSRVRYAGPASNVPQAASNADAATPTSLKTQ